MNAKCVKDMKEEQLRKMNCLWWLNELRKTPTIYKIPMFVMFGSLQLIVDYNCI